MYGSLEELLRVDFGGPLHCMAICGEMHALEEEVYHHVIFVIIE